MYKIAICEDEQIQTDILIKQLETYMESHKIKFAIECFSTGEELLKKEYYQYDLIFLDIKLSGINGIDVAKEVRKTCGKTKIIFMSAYQNYWPEGYKVKASRFLIKPIQIEEITEALSSVIDELDNSRQYVMVRSDKMLVKVLIKDITHLEIYGRKVLIHTINESYSSTYSLANWYQQLKAHHFEYTHSSYLVNFKYVKMVGRDQVTLTTGKDVYMSLRKYKPFKTSFIQYMSQL